MDRRNFLGMLAAMGFVTSVRSLWQPASHIETDLLDEGDLAWGYGQANVTRELFFANRGDDLGYVEVRRLTNSGLLMQFGMAPGGIVRIVPSPGRELIGPLRLIMPASFDGHVVGTDASGALMMATRNAAPVFLDRSR